jgi:thioredoxin reductase (NADPH)
LTAWRGLTEVYEVCKADLQQIISERPALSDLILQTFIIRARALSENESFTGLRVIGSRFSTDTFRIRDFLSKNHVLYTFFDPEIDAEVGSLLKTFNLKESDLPVVGYGQDWLLRNPSNEELAERIGIKRRLSGDRVFDLVIVGAGPAGLAAAVYGASEGLETIALDLIAAGGQAGTSSKIENYLGFPTGLSGAELASRAVVQAEKFGAELSIPSEVAHLDFAGNLSVVHLKNGEQLKGKALLIASGADYRRTGQTRRECVAGVFSFIGATPRTEWLPKEIELDAKGFVKTGVRVLDSKLWTRLRPPFYLETSRAGVFAAGDVRCDSVKRVASAVGEGSMAVQFVHEFLKEIRAV